jgi:large subunit ribosomal protein L21
MVEEAMYAVIRTGGKQYKVAPQDVLQIEKIEGAAGDAVRFADVLMVAGEGEPHFGTPLVSGAEVAAEVVEQARGPKIIIFKKKRRQNYRRKRGHRQELTTVRILEIVTGGKAAQAERSEAAPESEGESTQASAKKPRSKKAEKTEE